MIEINRFTLPNGLRIVHNQDSATAMVALNILYNVGSRDENPQSTGMAHLFEHLMFGGSKTSRNLTKLSKKPVAPIMHGPTATSPISTISCPLTMWRQRSGWKATA